MGSASTIKVDTKPEVTSNNNTFPLWLVSDGDVGRHDARECSRCGRNVKNKCVVWIGGKPYCPDNGLNGSSAKCRLVGSMMNGDF